MPLFVFALLVFGIGVGLRLQLKSKPGPWQLTASTAQAVFANRPERYAVFQQTGGTIQTWYVGNDEQAATVAYRDAMLARRPGTWTLWDRVKSTAYPVNQWGVS